jgi:ketosteroid isomerase-like protein
MRKWMQASLDESAVEVTSFVPGPMQVADRMAFRRFAMTGKRVPKKGGAPVPFNYKYLDILQKQSDGSWKFVSRIWNSNEDK